MMYVMLHIAELLHWRVTFGVVFLVILICVATYTLYKTYIRVVEHNKMAEKLRESATHSIRTKAVTQMLLDRTHTAKIAFSAVFPAGEVSRFVA